MASILPLSLLLTTLFLLTISVTSVPEDELSDALTAIHNHNGYSLFANAVSTSDLYYTLLSLSSFSLFPPTNPSVFSLDMSSASAEDYVSALSSHVVPRRLSLRSLRSASSSNLPTLDPRLSVYVQTRLDDDMFTVDGIHVVFPGMFYSRSIAVHGLASAILPRHQVSSPPVADLPENSDFSGNVVVPRHQTRSPPVSSDETVSVPPVSDLAKNSDLSGNVVVPRHRSPPTSVPPIADFPGSPMEVPAASLEASRFGDVAGPVQPMVLSGHVVGGDGNTFTREDQPRVRTTCPFA